MSFRQRRQILAIVVVPILISMFLLAVVLKRSLHEWAVERWSHDHIAFVSTLEDLLDAELRQAESALQVARHSTDFAGLPEVRRIDPALHGLPEGLDPGKRRMLEEMRIRGGFSVVFVLTAQGDNYMAQPFSVQRSLQRANLLDRPYIREALQQKTLTISDSFVGADGVPAVAMALPVVDGAGQVKLVIGGVLHLSRLSQLLNASAIAPFDRAMVIDRQGRRIADSDPVRLATAADSDLLNHPALATPAGTAAPTPRQREPVTVNHIVDREGKPWLAFATMVDVGWRLFLFRDESSLQEEIAPQARKLTRIVAGILLLPALLGVFMALLFSRRWQLAEAALQNANATLAQRVDERTAELKKSATLHRTLFESTADAVLILDQQQFLDCNPAALKIFGTSDRMALLGRHPAELSPELQLNGETSRSAADRLFAGALANGSEYFEWLHRRIDDGKVFVARVLLSRMEIEGRTLFQATVRDITQQKDLIQKLEDQRAHLEELVLERTGELTRALESAKLADRTKDAFLANISHELRTPLNAVIGMAEMARRSNVDARLRGYLDKIVGSGQHLNRIINDLLDLSKIAAGHMVFEKVPLRMSELLERCRELMMPAATEKGLRLVASVDAEVPEVLLGDPARIEQILINLLGNAVKFTVRGGIEARVSLRERSGERVGLVIHVIDSGVGMRAEDIERLFQPFTQADASVSRQFGGTGLGLAISRRLAQMMDGDIVATSSLGAGTTFSVTLWLEVGTPAAEQHAASAASAASALPERFCDTRVLVVDDQPLNREIVEALLEHVGVSTCLAENGREAVDKLIAAGPAGFDLVLMDVQMPVMDGLAATRELRSHAEFADLPVIAMTAHTMEHEKKISFAAGMNDHIGKPFDNASFFGTLARWIPREKQVFSTAPVEIAAAPSPEPAQESSASPRSTIHHLPGVDVDAALARMGGREERYRHWLHDFAQSAAQTLDALRADIDGGRREAAVQAVHTLKGRVGMLGMTDLQAAALALETALRNDRDPAAALAELQRQQTAMATQILTLLDAAAPAVAAPSSAGADSQERVQWNDSFSVGEPRMDRQHMKLIGMINQLAECIESPGVSAARRFHEVLAAMSDYTRSHFKDEEAYLQGIGYPHLEAHGNEHTAFVERMIAYSAAAMEGRIDMVEVRNYLKQWLLGHILNSDMQYRRFAEARAD